jgi:hypothetical protein
LGVNLPLELLKKMQMVEHGRSRGVRPANDADALFKQAPFGEGDTLVPNPSANFVGI